MGHELMGFIKNIFWRSWFFYLIFFLALAGLVDFKATIDRFQTRDINDAVIDMETLVLFNARSMAAQDVAWGKYINYFKVVQKYIPSEPVSEMYLALSNYYSKGLKDDAWRVIRRSADKNPLVFWNVYNAGVLAFERKDMPAAADYFQKVLILPEDKVQETFKLSVIYRQMAAASDFYGDLLKGVRGVKEDVYLFLSAAYFNAGDFEKSRNVARYALDTLHPKDEEPFCFYAASAALSLGDIQNAMSSLIKCINLKSKNPLVYRYAGRVFKAMGNEEGASSMLKIEHSLPPIEGKEFFYKDRLRLRFF